MCRSDVGKIRNYLEMNLDVKKGLPDWCFEINQILPKNRQLTKRELAYIFNRIFKNKCFVIDYESDPIQYSFSLVTS